jgi:hypothetical protein
VGSVALYGGTAETGKNHYYLVKDGDQYRLRT